MGGLDRIATVLKRIRAERGDKILFLDGGDTWQGSYTSLKTKGQDMVEAMNPLKPDAMTGHWEFTYGTDRVKETRRQPAVPVPRRQHLRRRMGGAGLRRLQDLRARRREDRRDRPGLPLYADRQSALDDPQLVLRHPRGGHRQEHREGAQGQGADLVVLLSHNGFDVDRKLAARVPGIDVILTGHTHDALPEPVIVGKTLLIASGSHGKFVSRLDLDVRDGALKGYRYRLIPVFSDVISPDAETTSHVSALRAPFEKELKRELATTESLLYRRGNFNGTFDDLFCEALLDVREAEIALSPGFRWGTSVAAGPEDHGRGSLQRLRHDLSGGLPLRDVRQDAQGHHGGRRRQPVQPRPLLPAGRRHGARRRHGLHDRPERDRWAAASRT